MTGAQFSGIFGFNYDALVKEPKLEFRRSANS